MQFDQQTKRPEAVCSCSNEKRAVLVSVKVLDNMVDLFDIESREDDSKFIHSFNS